MRPRNRDTRPRDTRSRGVTDVELPTVCHPGQPSRLIRDPGPVRREYVFFVYILASRRNGTLYVGVTNDLLRRVGEHREGRVEGFTSKYGVKMLVWYEVHQYIDQAITREKRIKRWRRDWKLKLIEAANPQWRDLYPDLLA